MTKRELTRPYEPNPALRAVYRQFFEQIQVDEAWVRSVKDLASEGSIVYVLRNLNFFARVALCGSISQYNATTPPMGPRLLGTFVGKRVRAQGFIVTDFANKYDAAMRQMGEWIKSGHLKYREDVVQGIDKAPRAFIGLLRGENFGKLLVKM